MNVVIALKILFDLQEAPASSLLRTETDYAKVRNRVFFQLERDYSGLYDVLRQRGWEKLNQP